MVITGIVVALGLITFLAEQTNGFALLLLVGVDVFGWQKYRGGNQRVGMGSRPSEHEARRLADQARADQAAAAERDRARRRTEESETSARLTRLRDVQEILKLSPKDFERMMALLLGAQGRKDVQVVGKRGDLGVDITLVTASAALWLFCKRWAPSHKIGSLDVQHFIGMAHVHHKADIMLFVTTSDYTADAAAQAKQYDIRERPHPGALALLGQKFKGEKLAAPNHPHAPDFPLAQKLEGPVVVFIDRIRDASRATSV